MALSQSVVLDFNVNGAPPLTALRPYIGDVDYSALVIPEFGHAKTKEDYLAGIFQPGKPGDPLTTNSKGSVNGKLILPRSVVAGLPSEDVTIKFYAKKRIERGQGGAWLDWEGVVATITTKYKSLNDPIFNSRTNQDIPDKVGTSSIPSMASRGTIGGTSTLAPIAQTFFVDATRYPYGIFVSSIELFFAAKDDTASISIELRDIVNGLPDASQYIAGSISVKEASSVNIPADTTNGPIVSTKFTMTRPIQLNPGEYAICIRTTSENYSLYHAKLGEYALGSNTILDKESYAGKLYQAQNTSVWLEEKNTDICFRVNKAVFETGTKQFEIQTAAAPGDYYHNLYLNSSEYNFGDLTSVTYSFKGTPGDGTFTEYSDITGKTPIKTVVPFYAENTGDIKFQVTMENKSKDISPIFDMKQTTMYTFKNNIEPYETDTSDSELASTDGIASSKYISKVVTLQDGFDSTGLEVRVGVNRQQGTDIEVFCRVQSPYDSGADSKIESKNWRRMPLFAQYASATGANTAVKSYAGTNDNVFSTEVYKILEGDSLATTGTQNLSYTANVSSGASETTASQTTFNTFNKFQIKIVMYAASTDTYIPKINGIIATAVL